MGGPGAAWVESDHGWYGKIPAAGDFIQRRLSREWVSAWDGWLRLGLAGLANGAGEHRRDFLAAPIWNFAIPSGTGRGAVRLGCVAPSRDRVGRLYPVGAVLSVAPAEWRAGMLEAATAYYAACGAALFAAVRHGCDAETLDRALVHARTRLAAPDPAPATPRMSRSGQDILDVLNAGRPEPVAPACPQPSAGWPALADCFNPASHTSYWWTNQCDGAPLQTYVHGGALNATLFARLFLAGMHRLR